MNSEKRWEIFNALKREINNPTTELIFKNPFELLIAVILSAQTTDIQVNKVTDKLFKVAPTPEALAKLSLASIESIINKIGLYKNKAKNIQQTCRILINEFSSQIPRKRVDLEKLPGVGRKTANVILNTIFNEPVIAVDTHIFRLANRINLGQGKTPLEVEKKLTKTTPKEFLKDAHHLLILHGRYTCKAQKPNCLSCCINHLCEYKYKNI
ncbi:MAG: endonuclease III [Proteobacteria bacterium]|jgi:endonuclease III|nr:endonuclease III [Pseudomonadota bacterium]MDA0942388.1 endonuclease III [Pseudomonadota bacterium]